VSTVKGEGRRRKLKRSLQGEFHEREREEEV